jgi:hypothetical protein
MYDWFRYHHGTPYDMKLGLIAKKAGARRCEVTAIWDCLLDHASQHEEDRGSIIGIDYEVIAFSQEIDVQTVCAVIEAMKERGIIIDDTLANWHKRQPEKEDPTAAQRKRNQRAREAEARASASSLKPSQNVTEECQNDAEEIENLHHFTDCHIASQSCHEMSRLDKIR